MTFSVLEGPQQYYFTLLYWRRSETYVLFARKSLLGTWKELAHKCDDNGRHLLFWLAHHFFLPQYQHTNFLLENILSLTLCSPVGALCPEALSSLPQGQVYERMASQIICPSPLVLVIWSMMIMWSKTRFSFLYSLTSEPLRWGGKGRKCLIFFWFINCIENISWYSLKSCSLLFHHSKKPRKRWGGGVETWI